MRRGWRRWLSTGGLLVAALGAGTPASGQVGPTPDPGVLLREEQRREQMEKRPDEAPIAVEAERQAPPEGAEQLRFVLQSLEVDGATSIPVDTLRPLWQELLGREISLADLYEIADAVAASYRNQGYVLTVAVVPPQEIQEGRARIRVVEGFVQEVRIRGERPALRGLIEAHARRIEASRPLRAADLEKSLLLINDLPGIFARAVLVPAEGTLGASILELDVEQTELNAFVQTNNFGSRFNGPYRIEGGLTANGIFQLHESTAFRTIHTFDDELHLYQGVHQQTLNHFGTQLDLGVAYVDTESGSTLSELDIQGDSLSFTVGASQPILRSRSRNLSAFLRFDYLDSQSDILGDTDTEDHIRALRLGARGDFVDAFRGISQGSLTLTQGLPIFGYSEEDDPDNSRPEGSSEHTKLELSASRLQGLPFRVNLLVEVLGQLAFSDLLISEEFAYGGRRIGRAYEVGELTGDHGIATLVELQYGFPLPTRYLESAQLFTSYDYGSVWNRESGLPRGKQDDASSWAAGFRVNLTTWLAAEGMVALPLTRDRLVDNDDRDPRFLFSLSARWPAN